LCTQKIDKVAYKSLKQLAKYFLFKKFNCILILINSFKVYLQTIVSNIVQYRYFSS